MLQGYRYCRILSYTVVVVVVVRILCVDFVVFVARKE